MATYQGYNLKINGIVIPNSMIVPGSYTHVAEKRIRSDRTDANGIHRFKYHKTPRNKIAFTIKEGTKEEYDTVRPALENKNNVPVKFWSEDDNDYMTGTFEMKAPSWQHKFENESTFYYAETTIELEEH